jgi:hypothetical protein
MKQLTRFALVVALTLVAGCADSLADDVNETLAGSAGEIFDNPDQYDVGSITYTVNTGAEEIPEIRVIEFRPQGQSHQRCAVIYNPATPTHPAVSCYTKKEYVDNWIAYLASLIGELTR